ncbi:hypothetical protein U9M48_029175 [Paspalum notatum var. saurae]|uniref:DUF8040 domain-containing protein n=1 Tax=Paspalum notatum var. saurae TaxID=547442 RepID=A0AAQ3TYC6_PASNO
MSTGAAVGGGGAVGLGWAAGGSGGGGAGGLGWAPSHVGGGVGGGAAGGDGGVEEEPINLDDGDGAEERSTPDFQNTECRKLHYGNPNFLEELEEMFKDNLVDGSTSYVLGQEEVEEYKPEEEPFGFEGEISPMSSNSRKRLSSTRSTATGPGKKSKSLMVHMMREWVDKWSNVEEANSQRYVEAVEDKKQKKAIQEKKLALVEKKLALKEQKHRSSVGQILIVRMMASIYGTYYDNHKHKAPRRTPTLFGYAWVQETLADSSSCFKMFRMNTPLFHRLHDLLVNSYGLRSTSNFSSIEALAMFLWMVGAPQSMRQAENRFMRSTETISRTYLTMF